MYIKILSNLKKARGNQTLYIYGGLDINKISYGVVDVCNDTAVGIYDGGELNDNVVEITENEYNLFCENVKKKTESKKITIEEKITMLEEENSNLQAALLEAQNAINILLGV